MTPRLKLKGLECYTSYSDKPLTCTYLLHGQTSYSDTPLTVTLLIIPEGVLVSCVTINFTNPPKSGLVLVTERCDGFHSTPHFLRFLRSIVTFCVACLLFAVHFPIDIPVDGALPQAPGPQASWRRGTELAAVAALG